MAKEKEVLSTVSYLTMCRDISWDDPREGETARQLKIAQAHKDDGPFHSRIFDQCKEIGSGAKQTFDEGLLADIALSEPSS